MNGPFGLFESVFSSAEIILLKLDTWVLRRGECSGEREGCELLAPFDVI